MKTFVVIFILITGSLSSAVAQSFLPQNSGVITQLNGISFATSSSGIVVGNSGVIRKTTNSGLLWSASSSGTTADLTDVAFISPTTYIAVGESGTMLKTTNSGTSWSVVNSGTTNDLLSIYVNGQYVFVTGANGTVLKSSNYGNAWTTLNTGISLNLRGAYFVSDVTGFVVGDAGTILKTVNGGSVWTFITSGAAAYSLTSVCFPDGFNGVITGVKTNTNQSVILFSDNAGSNWESDNYLNTCLNKISFPDYMQGYLAGGSNVGNTSDIYKSTNHGENWVLETSSSSRQLGICTPSLNTVYTCGLNGTILRYAVNTAGIEDQAVMNAQICPNPGAGLFSIASEPFSNETFSVEVFSAAGQFLFGNENTTEIDLLNYPSGVYLVVIGNGSEQVVRKLVKE